MRKKLAKLLVIICFTTLFVNVVNADNIFVESIMVEENHINTKGVLDSEETANKIIINSVVSNKAGKTTVKGKIDKKNKQIVCLVTDENEKIVYIDQKASRSYGTFTFEFQMPEWATTGTYTVKCGGETSKVSARATFEYEKVEKKSKVEIVSTKVTAKGKVTVDGKIDGENKQIVCLVTNKNKKIAYIDQKASRSDGTFTFEFQMPEWAATGTYTVKCGGETSIISARATFEYEKVEKKSNIEIVNTEVTENGKVTVNGKTDGGNKQIVCLVTDENEKIAYIDQKANRSDGTFTFEFQMPEWAATGTYTVKCGGETSIISARATFEYISPNSIRIIAGNIDENGNVSVIGRSPKENDNITFRLIDNSGEEMFTEQKTTEEDGSFSFSFVMPVSAEPGIYTIECANESISEKISLQYDKYVNVIAEIDIDKNVNDALYTALKKERRQLDSDNDGIITAAELNSLTGSIDLSNRNISDINGLQALTQVTDIYINNNKIENVDVLANLENLKRLDLSNNNISNLDIVPKNLTALHIDKNDISNADCLRRCNNLVYLFADNNNISDIKFVKVMTHLKTLSMQNNIISDISVLENITGLGYLNLSVNEITDVSALKNCNELYDIRLSNNYITNISSLPKKLFFNAYVDGNNIPLEQRTALNAIVKKY